MQFPGTGVSSNTNPLNEIQLDSTERKADTYQYTTMFQMFSPEILFDVVPTNSSTKFRIIGGAQNTYNAYWGQERNVTNKVINTEGKAYEKLSPHATGGTNININGSVNNLIDRGLISETNGSNPNNYSEFNQWYREYSDFIPANNILDYFIYGNPETVERGQGRTIYNNNSKYEYSNSLEGFLTDGEDDFDDDGPTDRAIISLNSFGAKNITMVAGNSLGDDLTDTTAIALEDLYSNSGMSDTDVTLMSELVRPKNDIYLGNIYSGNSYEDKKRTTYIKIGEYQDINTTSVQIDSPGDTYVQTFKFFRINKTDTEVYTIGVNQIAELVSFNVETSSIVTGKLFVLK
jgi:hypothetical protein